MTFRISCAVVAAAFMTAGALGSAASRQPPASQQQLPPPAGQETAAAAQDQGRTVWDGVYTAEQAARGKAAYTDQCSSCHGADLSGGEMAPPLSGALFAGNWDGLTAGDLTERIRITMPQGKEGTLSRQDVADIVAAVFAANSFPTGTTELAKELEVQKTIKITMKK
jgi:mono/diheme cytochrome c family protein